LADEFVNGHIFLFSATNDVFRTPDYIQIATGHALGATYRRLFIVDELFGRL